MDKPQIILHVQQSLNYTIFDSKWIPCSTKFVALGNYARGTGALQIYDLSHGSLNLVKEVCISSFPIIYEEIRIDVLNDIKFPRHNFDYFYHMYTVCL